MVLLKKHIYFFTLCFSFLALTLKAQDPLPIADFQVNNLCFGNITTFINTSTSLKNQTYKWTIWQMGNAVPIYTTSSSNIYFQFPTKTTYTVELNVTNYVTATHFHSDVVSRIIAVDTFPIANFDFRNCHSSFSNLSCCTNTCSWDFGDGTPTSTVTSPVHTYSVYTNYTVTLISGNGLTSDTTTQIIAPYPNTLTGDFNVVYYGDTVKFNPILPTLDDTLKANFWDWEWSLGDGTFLDLYGPAGLNVKHVYQRYEKDSVYTAFLSVKDLCFEAHKQKPVLIKGTGKNVTSTYVFPSPVVYGYLNIESVDKTKLKEIRIVDCIGKRLDNFTIFDKPYGYYLWIGEVATGVYIVQLVFDDRIENHKIVKE